MAEVNVLVHSFNNGEASPAALNRIDKEGLRLYAEYQENIIPTVVGKGVMRPGTQFILKIEDGKPEFITLESSDEDVPDAIVVLTDELARFMINDAFVTRPSVTSSVTNGNFSSSTGWTLTVSDGATGNINSSASGALFMAATARGSSVICTRSVSTSSAGTLHALRIIVTRGPVTFRCGETSGSDEYISEVQLETGEHSLAFTPSGTYHVWFKTERQTAVIVDSITVEAAGVLTFTTPWTEADVGGLRWWQSEDVLFVGSQVQQRRIERRGDGENSWALVYYKTDDGPFTAARTAKVRLQPTATFGNTTLIAESDFFKPEHVGALFRLDHNQFSASFQLAGSGQYTDPWRVTGVRDDGDNNDRNFDFTTTGTWVGTVTMERSIDSEFDGFRAAGYDDGSQDPDFTTNVGPIAHIGSQTDNNAIIWYRLGFQEGEYTSGTITINITYDGHYGYGICRVTGYNSPTSVSIEVLRDFRNTTFTDNWVEGEWSDHRGWPNAVEGHDGRLFWGRAGKYWGSESDNFSSFNSEKEGDSRTIARSITIGASATIRWLLSLQRLIFGVRSGEISARSSSFDEPLTATNITLKSASTQGVADVPPVKIDSRGIYLQRSGLKLYELAYDVEANDYQSVNIMRINEDLGLPDYVNDAGEGEGFTRLGVQRQPDTHVWSVRNDGLSINLLYEPSEKVRGFWRFVTGNINPGELGVPWDQVVTTAILPSEGEDVVYLGVRRMIDGAEVYHVEKMRRQSEASIRVFDAETSEVKVRNGLYMADSFVTFTGNSTVGQVVTGYNHLIGRTVILIGQKVDTGVDDAFTKVLLHFNGDDAATTFKDESGKSWTPAGNAQLDSFRYEFGGSSGMFDGSGDYLSTADHADFALGSGDFTIDAWFNCAAPLGTARAIMGQTNATLTAAASSFVLRRETDGTFRLLLSDGSALGNVQGTTVFSDEDNPGWHHIAVVRSSNTLMLFIDGVLEDSDTFTGTVNNVATSMFIAARDSTNTDAWHGWLDEIRLSVGVARWTDDFTVPDEPYGTPNNHVFGPVLDSDRELELVTVDASGQITLPVAMAGVCVAGLPYRGRYKSSKLAYGTEGTALLQKKAVHGVGLALLNTHPDAIRTGPRFGTTDEMDELPREKGDGTYRGISDDGFIEKAIDESTFSIAGEWDTDARVCIEIRPGHSATLSALVMNIEASERGQ